MFGKRAKVWRIKFIKNQIKVKLTMTVREAACVKFTRRPTQKFNSPVSIVQKSETNSDGSSKTRLVIDFTKLNFTKPTYIQPTQDIFARLREETLLMRFKSIAQSKL